MKKKEWVKVGAVVSLLVCAALPQLLLYYRGYYYDTDAPSLLKYPLNAGCFIGVAMLGYWYFKQGQITFVPFFWNIIYWLGGIFIAIEYLYHFIFPGWGTQTYLNTMGVFEILVSPLPFIIAWLLLYVQTALGKRLP